MTIVAVVRDLMDRSKIAARSDVRAVPSVAQACSAHAEVLIVDLSAVSADDLATLATAAPVVVGFGPHVDNDLLDAARHAGFTEVMARSVFFARLDAVLDRALEAAADPTSRNERERGRWSGDTMSSEDEPTLDTSGSPPRATAQHMVTWAEALAGIARTGLGFTESLYERERFEEILKVASEIQSHALEDPDHGSIADEWMKSVGSGVPGYVTPKIAVGAVVGNDAGQILLVQRADSGIWLYPTGWADIGYSAAEIAQKEVFEETGIQCVPQRVISILDGMRLGFTRIPLYSIVFHCTAVGGELEPHPLETSDVGWFDRDELPDPIAGVERWGPNAFAAIEGQTLEPAFDPPRTPPWEATDAGGSEEAD